MPRARHDEAGPMICCRQFTFLTRCALLSLSSVSSRIKFLSPRFSFSDRQAKYTYEKFLASSEHIFFRFLMRCFFKVFRNDRYVWYLIVLFIRWFDCFEKLSSFILVNQGLNIRHALLRLLASSLFYDLRRKTELLTIAAHRWTSFEQCC